MAGCTDDWPIGWIYADSDARISDARKHAQADELKNAWKNESWYTIIAGWIDLEIYDRTAKQRYKHRAQK